MVKGRPYLFAIGLYDFKDTAFFDPSKHRQSGLRANIWEMSLNTFAIIFAVLGACSELFGLAMVVREISGDRDRARGLLDKRRNWKPEKRGSPRRVSASAINVRPSGLGSLQVGGAERQLASMFASLVTAHNELVHDSQESLDQRTAALLEEIDKGDKELREVLRELLGENIRERVIGVVAIASGIVLSMTASILSSLG